MKSQDLKPTYIAITALSLVALFPLPYGYYTFLKICVTVCAGVTAYLQFSAGNKNILTWACVAIAILFNPIIPIHLKREIWAFMDVAVAGLFGFLAYNAWGKKV